MLASFCFVHHYGCYLKLWQLPSHTTEHLCMLKDTKRVLYLVEHSILLCWLVLQIILHCIVQVHLQVNPAWQRSGLGRGLVERLTARLVNEDITIISLYAEPNVVGLYNRLGFVASPDGIKGMAFQKSSKPGKALMEQAAATTAVAA